MAFRELKGTGGKNFYKWKDIGQSFEGVFKALATGMFEGKVTYHAIFVDREGKSIQVNTPTILRDKLTEAEAGMNLRLTYVANLAGKNGRTGAKDFRVEVLGEQVPDAPQPTPPAPTPQDDPIEAAKRMLLAAQNAGKSSYEQLLDKLREKDAKGAPALIAALEQVYKTEPERVKALRDHLKAQGVTV